MHEHINPNPYLLPSPERSPENRRGVTGTGDGERSQATDRDNNRNESNTPESRRGVPGTGTRNEAEMRQGVTGTGTRNEHDTEARRGVPGTGSPGSFFNLRDSYSASLGAYHNRSDTNDSEYNGTNIGYVSEESNQSQSEPSHHRSHENPYHKPYEQDPYRRVSGMATGYSGGNQQEQRGTASSNGFMSKQDQSFKGEEMASSNGGGGLEEIISQFINSGGLSSILPSIMPMIEPFINQLTESTGANSMSDLGTAALAALASKGDSTGGLGSGVIGGALGALLLSALTGNRGLLGGGVIPAAVYPTTGEGMRAALGELELQQTAAGLKDNISNVQTQISNEFAARETASQLRSLDQQQSFAAQQTTDLIGQLSKQIEEVKGFLTLNQKDQEIRSLAEKNQAYADELSTQRLANMFKSTQDRLNIQMRDSNDSIHKTVRAILPLLVPAAAGGGNNISVDRVTEIVNALATMADNQATVSNVSISQGATLF